MSETAVSLRFVYLIRHGALYKLGSSADPVARLAQLVPPGEGQVVHQFASLNAFQIENTLQARFASLRADGPGREWFHLGPDDVDAICRLSRTDAIDDLPPDLRSPTKPAAGPQQAGARPITFRSPAELTPRLDAVAAGLGLDVSNLVRMILFENLEQYEERVARLAQRKKKPEGE